MSSSDSRGKIAALPPEPWERVKALFKAAGELPVAEREGYIASQCEGDATLRAEVLSLLAADGEAERFMEPTVFSGSSGSAPNPADILVGRKIGGYTLIRVLGHGGMGTVYEAEQEEPRRRVALKIVRGGSHVDQHVLRLFRRETLALGRLNHPNIAVLHDAGHTEDGQHYFVMELVEGMALTAHARNQKLTLNEKLVLFAKVCDGIAYAHQRGVIHRDIKPSNILVAGVGAVSDRESDSAARLSRSETAPTAQPKVLDFGLAKITESDIALTTLTRDAGKIQGTLAYMSPEQAQGRSNDIDLRSDIYSLGVLLYELLTGQLPYDVRSWALPHAVRLICDQAPQRPSAINRLLRGDLETILLKALEKEPTQRFQTVAALAQDIERYRTGQPILARPQSAGYQFKKLVKRHKLATAGFVTVFALTLAFAGAVTALYGRSQRNLSEATLAHREAAEKAESYAELSEYLLNLVEHSSPRSADDIANETWTYVLLGKPLSPALHELVNARRQALLAKLAEPGDHLSLAVSLTNIGNLLRGGGELDAAEDLLRRALDLMRQAPERFGYYMSYPYSALRQIAAFRGDYAGLVAGARAAYELRMERLGPGDVETLRAMLDLAAALILIGEHVEAERLCREALPAIERGYGESNEFLSYGNDILGAALHMQKRFAEAERFFRRALAVRAPLHPDDHPEIARCRLWLAACLLHLGRRAEAEDLLRRIPPDSPLIVKATFWRLALKEVARYYVEAGEKQAASELLGSYATRAFQELESNLGEAPPPESSKGEDTK